MPQTAERDYYEVLGVAREATADEIKKAYRKRALRVSPGPQPRRRRRGGPVQGGRRGPTRSSPTPEKRARYDRFGRAGVSGNGRRPAPSGFSDISDIFSAFSDIFGGAGASPFGEPGGPRRRRGQGRPGSDLRVRLKLTLGGDRRRRRAAAQAAQVRRVRATAKGPAPRTARPGSTTCPTCQGAGEVRQVSTSFFGQFVNVQPCPTCDGEGRTIVDPLPRVRGRGPRQGRGGGDRRGPARASRAATTSRSVGAGNAGLRGGPPGALRVEIEEQDHEHFERDGLDIVHDLFLSFPDAALGAEATVPDAPGPRQAPGGRRHPERPDLADAGPRACPRSAAGRRGDQLVRVHVWTPEDAVGAHCARPSSNSASSPTSGRTRRRTARRGSSAASRTRSRASRPRGYRTALEGVSSDRPRGRAVARGPRPCGQKPLGYARPRGRLHLL